MATSLVACSLAFLPEIRRCFGRGLAHVQHKLATFYFGARLTDPAWKPRLESWYSPLCHTFHPALQEHAQTFSAKTGRMRLTWEDHGSRPCRACRRARNQLKGSNMSRLLTGSSASSTASVCATGGQAVSLR